MANDNETPKKRKRGRPPKKEVEIKLPDFKDENEIRQYILFATLELALECKVVAQKKNNIKKPNVANAKNQQYKTAIQSFKVANDILDKLQISKLEEKVRLMEEGLIASSNANKSEEPSEETLEKIEKLAELTEQLAELKES